jgi:nitrate/nitrite transporter NarK
VQIQVNNAVQAQVFNELCTSNHYITVTYKRALAQDFLANASVWGLVLGYGFQGYTFYVYYNWFCFYAVKVRGLGIMQAAAWTSAPFLAMALLSPVGGWLSDRVARVTDPRKGRLTAV